MFCRKCGKEYEGKFCPNCGEPAEVQATTPQPAPNPNGVSLDSSPTPPVKAPFYSQTWFIVLMMFCCCFPVGLFLMWKYKKFNKPIRIIITALFAISMIVGIANQGNTTNADIASSVALETSTSASTSDTIEETSTIDAAESSKEIVSETTEETVSETTEETEKIPTEFKSALSKAYTYSETMNMSKIGIYNQLTSEYGEKFSAEAAQYAIDNIEADWNANALETAKTYSSTMNMSKAGVYDQLISEYGEQFTEEEAQYAIDHVEADWNSNALATAKTYQESMNMSPSAIRDQLTSEYGEKFTSEEAEYAIANLD